MVQRHIFSMCEDWGGLFSDGTIHRGEKDGSLLCIFRKSDMPVIAMHWPSGIWDLGFLYFQLKVLFTMASLEVF